MGRNELKTTDETLDLIWKGKVAPIPYHDDVTWIKSVLAILTAHGYRGELVE